jgi:hypothetical protein
MLRGSLIRKGRGKEINGKNSAGYTYIMQNMSRAENSNHIVFILFPPMVVLNIILTLIKYK